MPTQRIEANKSCVIDEIDPTYNARPSRAYLETNVLLAGFEPVPSNIRQKKINSIKVYAYFSQPSYGNGFMSAFTLESPFDEYSANGSNTSRGERLDQGDYVPQGGSGYVYNSLSDIDFVTDYTAESVIKNGVFILGTTPVYADTSRGSNPPYMELDYSDPTIKLNDLSPKGGYINKAKANTFSWKLQTDDYTIDEISQTSATFRWRPVGGSIHTVNVGTANSVIIPANTFTTDEIEWQVSATCSEGTFTSDWFKLTTIEPAPQAPTALTPSGVVVDGNKEVTFNWQHNIETGTEQTKFDLEISTDGATWTSLHSETTNRQNYTVPSDTLSSDATQWRVRTYNTDNVTGEWSTAKIIVIVSPAPPIISIVESTPRPLITWQASEQSAYEIAIDGVSSGVKFGVAKQYKYSSYLQDGPHQIKVRVQNKYGLWSDWGTINFTSVNVTQSTINLTVGVGYYASLTWETEGDFDKYYIFRNDICIGKTTAKFYADNTSVGNNSYYVVGFNGDNFSESNKQYAEIYPETIMLCDLTTNRWYPMPTSDSSNRLVNVSEMQRVSYTHYQGATYPGVEVSEFKDKTLVFDVAFENKAKCAELELLLSKLVCVKDKWGNMAVGLFAYGKGSSQFYQSYQCSVTQIARNEVVEFD